MDRGAWRATVHGITELDTTEQLPFQKNSLYLFCSFSLFEIISNEKILKISTPGTHTKNVTIWLINYMVTLYYFFVLFILR